MIKNWGFRDILIGYYVIYSRGGYCMNNSYEKQKVAFALDGLFYRRWKVSGMTYFVFLVLDDWILLVKQFSGRILFSLQ